MPETKVLIIEDEDALSTILEYNLAKENFEVALATDGEEGLLKVEEFGPDIIILDWMLPKVSGIEVCRRIRSKPESRNIPIIMLTARSEEADRIRGLETGADDYLTKPFSTAELIARLKAILRRIRPGLADDLDARRQGDSSRTDRISPARSSDSASGAGFLTRAIIECGLGI